MDLDEVLAATFTLVAPHLTERQRRLLLGAAARRWAWVSEVGSSLRATGYQQVRSVVAALAGDRAGAAQRDPGQPAAAMCATNRDLLAIVSPQPTLPSPSAPRYGGGRQRGGLEHPGHARHRPAGQLPRRNPDLIEFSKLE